MKRTLALLLALLMVLALAACGGSAPAEAPAAEDPAASEAHAAPAGPEAPAEEVTWDSYLNWLADTFGADSPDPEAYRALIFQAKSWDDIDVAKGPWDKLYAEDAFNASTWDEFVAAGGVGTYNTEYKDDASKGSGEPTGEASGEAYGSTWADYQQYLIDKASANSPDPEEFKAQVFSFNGWDELDLTTAPWDQLFTTVGLSTWEEFQAGVYKEPAVMGTASDEASGEASGQ